MPYGTSRKVRPLDPSNPWWLSSPNLSRQLPGTVQNRESSTMNGPYRAFFPDWLLHFLSMRRPSVFRSRLSFRGSLPCGPAASSALNTPSPQGWTMASELPGGLTSSSARPTAWWSWTSSWPAIATGKCGASPRGALRIPTRRCKDQIAAILWKAVPKSRLNGDSRILPGDGYFKRWPLPPVFYGFAAKSSVAFSRTD